MRPFSIVVRQCAWLAALWIGSWCSPAEAVIIGVGGSEVNAVAPSSNPSWSNVAATAGGSAVYLGNGWMITANHVGQAPVHFSNGMVLNVVPGSNRSLANPAGYSGTPDLRMFQVAGNPGLPALSMVATTPKAGSTVMMIGAGTNRGENLLSWQVTSADSGAVLNWKSATPGLSNVFGFGLLGTSSMQWGMNQVQPGGTVFTSSNTIVFSTRFDRVGVPYEAQAAPGDSGGGVFELVNGGWQLAGLIDAVQALTDQPDKTVVFGDSTYSTDLSQYRDQILNIVNGTVPQWQNPFNHYDVDHSGVVNNKDVLLLINEMNRNGQHDLTGAPGANDLYYDVNGDGKITPTDLIQVANAMFLNVANPPNADTLANNLTLVPEPSTAVLAGCGLASVWLAARLARRRRGKR